MCLRRTPPHHICRTQRLLPGVIIELSYVRSRVLTCCDMTTRPDGELVRIQHRHGPGHLVSRSIQRATPVILRASGRFRLSRLSHQQEAPSPDLAQIYSGSGPTAAVPSSGVTVYVSACGWPISATNIRGPW